MGETVNLGRRRSGRSESLVQLSRPPLLGILMLQTFVIFVVFVPTSSNLSHCYLLAGPWFIGNSYRAESGERRRARASKIYILKVRIGIEMTLSVLFIVRLVGNVGLIIVLSRQCFVLRAVYLHGGLPNIWYPSPTRGSWSTRQVATKPCLHAYGNLKVEFITFGGGHCC